MTTLVATKRLSLRRPTPQDALVLEDLWRDEKVREFLGGVPSDKMIMDTMKTLQNHWDQYGIGLWTVCKKGSQHLIGLCGLHHTEDGLELSYLFFPKYWGQGLAREAAHAILDYGFTVLKQDAVISITQEANLRSRHLLEVIGMKHIHNFKRFNELQSLYRLHQNEYLAVRATTVVSF